jgi:hypothetical protein
MPAATSTIAALTLVLAINLTDAAVFPTDDANGNTRKATIAQMRTQLNTGAQIFTTSVSVGTTLTVTGGATAASLTTTGTIKNAQTTTNGMFIGVENQTGTGHYVYLGVGSSVGADVLAGAAAYKPFLGGATNDVMYLGTNAKINMTLNTDQSVTFASSVSATAFSTVSGTVAANSGAATNFMIPGVGTYLVTVYVQAGAANVQAMAIFVNDGGNGVTLDLSTNGAITLTYNAAGGYATVTQTSGATRTLVWQAIKIG